jgi:hypothetical protein
MHEYDHLVAEAERPKRLSDHLEAWERLTPLLGVNGTVRERIEHFAISKRVSIESLIALGTRVHTDKAGGVELAWGYKHNGAVTAVKFRPLGEKKRYALTPSVFLEPLVIGNVRSLDWILAEGETDAARLFDLVGDVAAILVLPAGAKTFKRPWADVVPRGAVVALAYDDDEPGDAGAAKAAAILGGRTVRLRPPEGFKDWCEWPGEREEFLALASAVRGELKQFEFSAYSEFAAHKYPAAEPLLGEPGAVFLARGSLLMVYGADGSGKSTWTIDGLIHLAAGVEWLGIPVPRPVRFCVIENEGPPDLFQQKLAAKLASWDGPDPSENIFVFAEPWGEFSFANPEARPALNAFCEEHAIDVVTANPTLSLGVAASGRPDETQQFVDWLTECGLKSERAFWLLHHENKAGQISGDWGRHPDTKVSLQQDGNRQRTKLDWAKTRWATLPADSLAKVCMLEWIVETQGYSVTELDTVGASDAELEQRVADFLAGNPWASTRAVYGGVAGTQSRVRAVLDGDRFDCVDGPRGSILWNVAADRGGSSDDTPTQ